MAEENNEMVRVKEAELRKAIAKVEACVDLYNPEKFPAQLLQRNEQLWMKEMMDSYHELKTILIEVTGMVDEEQKASIEQLGDKMKDKLNRFTIEFGMKVLTVQPAAVNPAMTPIATTPSMPSITSNPSVSSVNSNAAKVAQVNVDVDYEKISVDIKGLSAELRRLDDWTKADEIGRAHV